MKTFKEFIVEEDLGNLAALKAEKLLALSKSTKSPEPSSEYNLATIGVGPDSKVGGAWELPAGKNAIMSKMQKVMDTVGVSGLVIYDNGEAIFLALNKGDHGFRLYAEEKILGLFNGLSNGDFVSTAVFYVIVKKLTDPNEVNGRLLEPMGANDHEDDSPEIAARKKKLRDKVKSKLAAKHGEHVVTCRVISVSPSQIDAFIKRNCKKEFALSAKDFGKESVYAVVKDSWRGGQSLNIDISIPFSRELYDIATEAMRGKIDKYIKATIAELKKKSMELAKSVDLGEVSDINIHGVKWLAAFDIGAVQQATAPLRRAFADTYHKLNSREVSRTVKTRGDMHDHAKKIETVLNAIGAL